MAEDLGARGFDFLAKNTPKLWKLKNGDKYYCGSFSKGRANGLGIIFVPRNFYYEGELRNGLPDGYGFLKEFRKS